jgi:hypothetical protein
MSIKFLGDLILFINDPAKINLILLFLLFMVILALLTKFILGKGREIILKLLLRLLSLSSL